MLLGENFKKHDNNLLGHPASLHLHLAVLFPAVVGGLLYMLFREESLTIFGLVRRCGAMGALSSLREALTSTSSAAPSWVFYSLPNALWVFSFTAIQGVVWRGVKNTQSVTWLLIPLMISVGFEFGQEAGIVPGYFSWCDVIGIVVAGILGLAVAIRCLESGSSTTARFDRAEQGISDRKTI